MWVTTINDVAVMSSVAGRAASGAGQNLKITGSHLFNLYKIRKRASTILKYPALYIFDFFFFSFIFYIFRCLYLPPKVEAFWVVQLPRICVGPTSR